jgi:mannose-6-phosphate isomerase-like protein (cupin superfamily)
MFITPDRAATIVVSCERELADSVCARSEVLVVEKVNLAEKLALIQEHYSPKIVGELNGQHIKLVKLQGEFVWHKHDAEDEMFLVISGSFRIEFRDHTVQLRAGEFVIVPRGIEHRPVAEHETAIMLFEPISTLNTGDVRNQMTIEQPERI